MIIRLPRRDYKASEEFHYLLMSDLHIGSAHCDKERIKSELEWARQNWAKVFIAGDVFDLIMPKDHKRYVPSMYDEALRGKDSILNASLNLATKLLKPYADLIEVVGCGNHETSYTKFNGGDIIALLVENLSTPKHPVRHGGYSGAIVETFRQPEGHGVRYCIRYHHGTGGHAPVTRGMIDFNRLSTWMRDADVIWTGHKHFRWASEVKEERIPVSGDKFERHPVWHIMTGSYDDDQGREQLDDMGSYKSDWGVEKAFAPQGRGGVKLRVRIAQGDARTEAKTEVLL